MKDLYAVAKSWEGTPFMPNGRIKGYGVSCQMLVAEIYTECGLLPPDVFIAEGPMDWGMAHKDSRIEKFIDTELSKHFAAVEQAPVAGDLLGFKIGGCVHHLGILCNATEFIHAMRDPGAHFSRIDDATFLKRLARVWRPI